MPAIMGCSNLTKPVDLLVPPNGAIRLSDAVFLKIRRLRGFNTEIVIGHFSAAPRDDLSKIRAHGERASHPNSVCFPRGGRRTRYRGRTLSPKNFLNLTAIAYLQ